MKEIAEAYATMAALHGEMVAIAIASAAVVVGLLLLSAIAEGWRPRK